MQPHASRRREIIKKYPQIEELYGPDIRPLPYVLAIMASQLYIATIQHSWSPITFFLVAWIYGGAAAHSLSLMTHELSHNLMFHTLYLNEWFGIFCNVAMVSLSANYHLCIQPQHCVYILQGVPSSTMFKRYHMEHHQFQGDVEKDVDVPTAWEGRFFTNAPLKAVWLLCQPLFYAFRPMIVRPKKPRFMDNMNTIVILTTDALICFFFGWRALLYLVLSTLLGMGFHPVAGHFISEHYVFYETQETYSYYGSLNYLCWNVGYHNEHHDFPRVAGWRLPEITAIAPEYYLPLKHYSSWTKVLIDYICDPKIGPFSRVVRHSKTSRMKRD